MRGGECRRCLQDVPGNGQRMHRIHIFVGDDKTVVRYLFKNESEVPLMFLWGCTGDKDIVDVDVTNVKFM